MIRLFLMLALLPLLAKSQAIKKDTILLKSLNKGDTLIYAVGDNRLYFELPQILKYLKKYKGSNIYKKQEIAILIAALKIPTHGIIDFQDTLVYDQQTGFIDTAAIYNKYVGALNEIIPNMLSDGQVMILDKKNNRPVPYLVLTKHWNGNYIGAFLEFTAFLPDDKRLCKFTIYEK